MTFEKLLAEAMDDDIDLRNRIEEAKTHDDAGETPVYINSNTP